MNAAARVLVQENFISGGLRQLEFSKSMLLSTSLIIAILVSALAVVYVKNLNRQLFSQVEFLEQQADRLTVKTDQLLLSESTWAQQSRVETIAKQRLHMALPKVGQYITISLRK